MNTTIVKVGGYDGVVCEIDNSKFTESELSFLIHAFGNFKTILDLSYTIGEFEVITLPLNKKGYRAKDRKDKYIFINSKLPKAERKAVARELVLKEEI